MNKLFVLPYLKTLAQIRIFEKNLFKKFDLVFKLRKKWWGTSFEFDLTMFGQHIFCLTTCKHRKEKNVRWSKR